MVEFKGEISRKKTEMDKTKRMTTENVVQGRLNMFSLLLFYHFFILFYFSGAKIEIR